MSRSDELDVLRALFVEELGEILGRLEAIVGAPVPEDHATRIERAREVHRSAHTLKGAARVVSYAALERLAHALEAALGRASGVDASSFDRALSAARIAVPALRDARDQLRRSGALDEAALREAAQKLDEKPASSAGPPVAPENASTPSRVEHEERLRVPVASIDGLLSASQELAAITTTRAHDRLDAIESGIAEVQARIERALRTTPAVPRHALGSARSDTRASLEAALESVRALSAQARSQRLAQARSWQLVRSAASRVAERSRALRVRSFDHLRPSVEATVLEAARSLGKLVQVEWHEESLEIDRRVLDALSEPLLHLARNAVDHGIEAPEARRSAGKPASGTITVRASLAGTELAIEVSDDGGGVDLDAVRVSAGAALARDASERDVIAQIFEPGLTTRTVATAFSGRGVGLDVVRQRVARLHGRIDTTTTRGRGTTFRLVVPSDLSVLRGLLVRARDAIVVVPTTSVQRALRVADAELLTLDGRLHVPTESGPVALIDLAALLGMPSRSRPADATRRPVIVVSVSERRIALRVDAMIDEREVVIHPLDARIRRLPMLSGGVVLETGELAILLDVAAATSTLRRTEPVADASATRVRRVLLVDDSVTTRQLERSLLEAAGFEVQVAADGLAAWALLLDEAPFDAVVSDLEMPQLDGFGLLGRIRATPRLASLPVILVTALTSEDDRQRAFELGASAYLTKDGFDEGALLATLEDFT